MRPAGWSSGLLRKGRYLIRRVVSHHGSDCSLDCTGLGYCRAVIFKRVDDCLLQTSRVWFFGNLPEGRSYAGRSQRWDDPAEFGGGFYERVVIPSPMDYALAVDYSLEVEL